MAKVERAAFIYLKPKPRDDKASFAQCGACRMFVPKLGRCIIHGSKVEIDEDDSCGFFVDWPTPDGKPNPQVVADHTKELNKGIPGSVTPEESGLVDDHVQCRNCEFFEAGRSICGLYEKLNQAVPKEFDLDIRVTPNSCCNAWTKKSGKSGMINR